MMNQVRNFTKTAARTDFIGRNTIFISLLIILLTSPGLLFAMTANKRPSVKLKTDTTYIAPPTGDPEIDRANFQAAFDAVQPGGTIQFRSGTYLLGEGARLSVPDITLLGHLEGTRIRGCGPARFEKKTYAVDNCNGFTLTGGNQTVRGFTFEYTWHALILGGQPCEGEECPPGTLPVKLRTGGYLIKDNIFRESQNGIRVVGQWQDPALIRDNNFINTYHAVVVNGMTAHIIDNHISVPEPEQIPNTYYPGLALMIGGREDKGVPICDRNIITGNKIKGHPDAIAIMAFEGGNCRQNIIRDNTIEMSMVHFDTASPAIYNRNTANPTISGVPLALLNDIGFGKGIIENNLIKENLIIGAEGLAIELSGASDNQICDNTITRVVKRNPFPGNTLFPKAPDWQEANGSAIWLSPGSNGNEIVKNTFKDIATAEVFIAGDSNRVEMKNLENELRDLGTGNLVSVRASLDGMHDSGDEDVLWSAAQLKRRAALIYIQHAGFSLVDARERGLSPSEQGRRIGEIIARNKRWLDWNTSSNALLSNALAKLIEPEFEMEFGWASFMLRSHYKRAAKELTRYGSNIKEYLDWLEGMHAVIGPVQGYAMTARIEGDWLVETYRDLPNRKELKPSVDLPLYEPSAEELMRYEGVYIGTRVGDTSSVEYKMHVWKEDKRLRTSTWRTGHRQPYGRHLIPVAEGIFLPGWYPAEGPVEVPQNAQVRFSRTDTDSARWVELEVKGGGEVMLWRLRRAR